MKNITHILEKSNFFLPEFLSAKKEDFLFFDIETTGLSPKTSCLYLFGCCYYENHHFVSSQWIIENRDEEIELLRTIIQFISPYKTLIHFNGNQFDIPFLKERCAHHQLSFDINQKEGIDLYKRIFPYRHFLKLSNCKQKTLEKFLGINRIDTYSGADLICVFREFEKTHDSKLCSLLLQHNYDDITGMLSVLPILQYPLLFHEKLHIRKVQCNTYSDVNQEKKKELLLMLDLTSALPMPISYHANGCYFSAKETEGLLKVPVYEEEMKYYYEDYKNYYYLPSEDTAIHKSVASYVDSAFREQACASTCYTRKTSSYLPQWDYLFEPFFKRDYKSTNLFFELTDSLKSDRSAFSQYASHILSMMLKVH